VAAAETDSCPGTGVEHFDNEIPEDPELPSRYDGRLNLRRSQKRLSRCPHDRRKYQSDRPASSLMT